MSGSNLLRLASFIGILVLINCAVPNCKVGTEDSCSQCNQGYNVISDGSCRKADPNCAIIYFSDGSCFKCQTGYTKTGNSNGQCVNASKNCKTFEQDGNTCSSCYPGYCNLQGNCITGDSNCRTFNQSCGCASCYYGQPSSDGKCTN